MKILVIDDNAWVARSIQRGLRDHDVTTEGDPRDAFSIVAVAQRGGAPFDVVICDLTMPHMNGHEVLAQLRTQLDPPILIQMSGDELSMRDGDVADGVLAKPCGMADILGLVATIKVARSKARTQAVSHATAPL